MNTSDWRRVSRNRQCPICGKPDWCLYAGPPDLPTVVICARLESGKRCGEAGWLHQLRDDESWQSQKRLIRLDVSVRSSEPLDFRGFADRCVKAMNESALANLASELGLTIRNLKRLGIGWSSKHGAWTFPMESGHGAITGIRIRLPNGRKVSVKGSKQGLFIPSDLQTNDQILIAEGPTDTAALLDLGFNVVGRPNCSGGASMLVEFVQSHKPTQVVIVADGDGPGQKGAKRLATVLVAYSTNVRIISPPSGISDARH